MARDDAQPFMADDLTAIDPCTGIPTSLFRKLELLVLLVIGFAIGSVTPANSARSAEQKRSLVIHAQAGIQPAVSAFLHSPKGPSGSVIRQHG